MSNLVDHARFELNAIGEDQDTIDGYLGVIQAISDMGHSGASAACAIPVINRLLQFKPLTELTNNPDEWYYHSPQIAGDPEGVWQNKRNSEAFSNDGGRSYYLLSERESGVNGFPLHTAKNFGS